jgi:hypothetical protein
MTQGLSLSGSGTRGRVGEADRRQVQERSGPRTAGGKARVAQNAIRHGLSLPVLADPATAAAVEALTRQMSEGADPETVELAQAVAHAQVDLSRVRRARHDLLAAALAHLTGGAEEAAANGPPPDASRLVSQLAEQLLALDRYERRALSRRKFAIRSFDEAVAMAKWRIANGEWRIANGE